MTVTGPESRWSVMKIRLEQTQGLFSESLTTAKGNFNSGIKKNEELSNDIQLPGRDDLFQNKQCNYEDLSSRLLNFTFQIMRRTS